MTYEIFLEIEHHPRHLEDWAQKLGYCWKLADGDPDQLIAACLRETADKLDPPRTKEGRECALP